MADTSRESASAPVDLDSLNRSVTGSSSFDAAVPDADIEIRIADGSEGEMLAGLQARVLWEVTKWQMAQSNSANGQDEAA
ncbi:hypothetical protein [Nocardia thraciensis]